MLAMDASAQTTWKPFLRADVFAHSEPVAIHDYVDKWRAPLRSGSDAVTHNWLEAGVQQGPWTFSYIQRYDYEIKANRDSAEFYHRTANKRELEPGRVYQLQLDAYHQRSQGLRLSYRWDAAGIAIVPGVSYLRGQSVIHGGIDGQASAVGRREYEYDAHVRYFYDEDVLFDREVDPPRGEGFSLDLSLFSAATSAWSWSIEGRDLIGFIDWREAPVTEANATSDTRELDEDGYPRFRPTLTGREFNEDYRQRLHPRAYLTAAHALGPASQLGAALRLTEVRSYLGLTAATRLGEDVKADVLWLLEPFALGAGLEWQGVRLAVLSDRLQVEDAHVLQLDLRLSLALP